MISHNCALKTQSKHACCYIVLKLVEGVAACRTWLVCVRCSDGSMKPSPTIKICISLAFKTPKLAAEILIFATIKPTLSALMLKSAEAVSVTSQSHYMYLLPQRIHLTSPVSKWMISKACLTMRTAISFLPLFRPCIMRLHARRSTMGHWALRKRFTW